MVATVKSRSVMVGFTPSGSLMRRDVHRVADLEPGQVDIEMLGDGVGRAAHRNLVAHDVEHAAALDAGEAASFRKRTGTSTVTSASLPTRMKSTWMGKSRMGSSCTCAGDDPRLACHPSRA